MPISGPETLASDEQTQSSNAPQSDIDHQEKRLIHGGVEYKTRKEMANALHVDYLKLNAYLRKYDDIDEAVGRCMVGKTSQSVRYDSYVHRSFTALCESYGIAPALVRKLAVDNGSDKMDAFSDLPLQRNQWSTLSV